MVLVPVDKQLYIYIYTLYIVIHTAYDTLTQHEKRRTPALYLSWYGPELLPYQHNNVQAIPHLPDDTRIQYISYSFTLKNQIHQHQSIVPCHPDLEEEDVHVGDGTNTLRPAPRSPPTTGRLQVIMIQLVSKQ